jgi:dephospho-CoA kinase
MMDWIGPSIVIYGPWLIGLMALLLVTTVLVYKRSTRHRYRIPESVSVALTGNIGSGKSTVAKFLMEEGVPVVSADELARQAVKPGSSGLREVAEVFGKSVLDADGSLNRKALGSLVFKDEDARKKLEDIVHPRIRVLRDRWMRERQFEIFPLSVSEVPLLFEANLQNDFDVSVVVSASEENRIKRLQEERDLDPEDSRSIMATQIESAVKEELADYVIHNNEGLDELRTGSVDVLQRVIASERHLRGVHLGRLRIDMHMHTRDSFDCMSDPVELLSAAKRKGIGRIALTDHNRLRVALEMAKDFPEEIIPGEEVKTREGVDLIGLYLSEEIPKGTSLKRTCSIIKEQGGISYLPHPYAKGKGGSGRYAEEMGKLVDVVEVFNSRLHPLKLNSLAESLADDCSKLRGAGSDAHTVGEVGRAYVEVERHPNDPGSLLAALKFSQIRGVESSRVVHLASTWAKFRR